MIVEDKARRLVLGAVDHSGLQRAEHLVVAHRDAIGAERVRHVDEHRIADDANLQALQIGDRFDRMLGVVEAARAGIHPAQSDEAGFFVRVTLSRSSVPMAPSITFCICAVLRNKNGRLNTLRSSITGPMAPTLTRAICKAPTCACSMASFSPPSCIEPNICTVSRPLVACLSFLPKLSTAATVG